LDSAQRDDAGLALITRFRHQCSGTAQRSAMPRWLQDASTGRTHPTFFLIKLIGMTLG